MAPSLFKLGAAALAYSAGARAVKTYQIFDSYDSTNFFDKFNFFVSNFNTDDYANVDPTHGYVNYRSRKDAETLGLIQTQGTEMYVGVNHGDTFDVSGKGRDSIRLESKATYTKGLIIASFSHLPEQSCGTWPAFWMFGDPWLKSGEIDLYEGYNLQGHNEIALHVNQTIAGSCKLTQLGTAGVVDTVDCNNDLYNPPYQYVGTGCTAQETSGTWGSESGATFAMEWTDDYIKIWSWLPSLVPQDIKDGTPDPTSLLWGLPQAMVEKSKCDIDKAFFNQKLVMNLDFCGDTAGNEYLWGESCQAATGYATCASYVAAEPNIFNNYFFKVQNIKVYTKQDQQSSTSSTISSTSTSSLTSSSTLSTTSSSMSTTSSSLSSSSTLSTTTSSLSSSASSSAATSSSLTQSSSLDSSTTSSLSSSSSLSTSSVASSTTTSASSSSSSPLSSSSSSESLSSSSQIDTSSSSTTDLVTSTSQATSSVPTQSSSTETDDCDEPTGSSSTEGISSTFTQTSASVTQTSASSTETDDCDEPTGTSTSDFVSSTASATQTSASSTETDDCDEPTGTSSSELVFSTSTETVTSATGAMSSSATGISSASYTETSTAGESSTTLAVSSSVTEGPSGSGSASLSATQSTSSSEEYTTSTIYSTRTYTITSCAPTVTNCPGKGHVTTEIIAISTTVCPVTETEKPGPKPTSSTSLPGYVTSTVLITTTYTITSCKPTVTNCPVGKVTSEILTTTTVCPAGELSSASFTTKTKTVQATLTVTKPKFSTFTHEGPSSSPSSSVEVVYYTATVVLQPSGSYVPYPVSSSAATYSSPILSTGAAGAASPSAAPTAGCSGAECQPVTAGASAKGASVALMAVAGLFIFIL